MKKTVLAYSGGLDTSVAIKWLQEKYGVSVIAMAADVGEGKDLDFIQKKALKVGAEKAYIIDAKEEFVKNYIFPALKANALYEGIYPVSSSLSRPLISKLLVDIAEKEGADSVAHGCTGKGNDQVRFDVSVTALNPELKIIAPVREWPMSREEEIEYAKQNDIPVPVGKENPFSIDQNLWGRSIECGVLEDPWVEPPEEAYEWTVSIENAPEQPEYIEIDFEKGVPVKLNNKEMNGVDLISKLNKIAGQHGVGRIDHVENRLIGIKSREIYECPAASVLIKAHQSLEYLTLPKETLHFKHMIDVKYGELIYNGLWFSQLKEALDAFINATQEHVTGKVKVKLHKGNCIVVGRTSPKSLYDVKLATYDEDDQFDHKASEGFIKIWGLPTKVYSMIKKA
ncbi:Argininosuccinate synthase [Koleobacter methoxysyntrophicus]|jgi:argininosuccinate synthase|uniref:Argininosuccinate synthase n=1 Tax=Koleobacter methoxysyntrophicus TaxID=2751313 RepID=A0A8A0RL10_9FIRM|nr:argininosuccinate synthase [Koleobacter methoxysyntrophicus]NPV43976.1 argininosuccinate synthase [Bacillota bacterium]QSQ08298.1 Argininosuccinate synthase [Koleobacter methoxysyntrophicus]